MIAERQCVHMYETGLLQSCSKPYRCTHCRSVSEYLNHNDVMTWKLVKAIYDLTLNKLQQNLF